MQQQWFYFIFWLLVAAKVFAVPTGTLLLYKLNSYLIVDTGTDLCSNRMIKCISRVPHLLTDRQQTLCLFSFLWFFHLFAFMLHWARISNWPTMWKCRHHTMALGKQKDHQCTQGWINFSILCKNEIAFWGTSIWAFLKSTQCSIIACRDLS